MNHLNIIATTEGAVGLITLNRPKALNALNAELLGELVTQLEAWDRDDQVRCIHKPDTALLVFGQGLGCDFCP